MVIEAEQYNGTIPVDFIIQTIIEEGLEKFRTLPDTYPDFVFGHLKASYLQKRYGSKKIEEIAKFIRETEIPVVQHWALVPATLPCFSIQLMDGREDESRAGLGDAFFEENVLDAQGNVSREQNIYAAIVDQIQIGIHNNNTPDITKYLYYFLTHLFMTSKNDMINRGLQLTTFQATDISRLNDYLPENIFSRFVNFTAFTTPHYTTGVEVPVLDTIDTPDGGFVTDEQSS